jgi:5-formyltetrahydrofolate cyclo-ligase
MEEIQSTKAQIRDEITQKLRELAQRERSRKTRAIETRLFDFANFLEAKIILFYLNNAVEVPTRQIIEQSFALNKIVVLPAFNPDKFSIRLYKVDDLDRDLRAGPRGIDEPDPNICKLVPVDRVELALIPGIAFDEKGGRIGSGEGYYDRLIPHLAVTTRKVSLAFEDQLIAQIPLESHDKYVDIIITDSRIVYKI